MTLTPHLGVWPANGSEQGQDAAANGLGQQVLPEGQDENGAIGCDYHAGT